MKFRFSKQAISWALYDWANSTFATTVMGVFFPIMFKEYWSSGFTAAESTMRLGMISSGASLAVAVLSPVLGIVADRASQKKKFLFLFTMLGVVMTGGLFWAAKGDWLTAGMLYLFASIGFFTGVSLNDALIVGVASEDEVDVVSALGYSLGYLGGGILFAVNVFMVSKPEFFGFADAGVAVRWSFLSVAVWWAVFSIPLYLYVPEPKTGTDKISLQTVKKGFGEIFDTLTHLRAHRPAFLFLIAYWLYIDGVDTVIRMAVDYGMSLGFETKDLMAAFLVTQFVGFPAAIAYGWIAKKTGVKPALYFGLAVYVGVVFWGYQMSAPWEFYALSVVVGLVQGGVQSLSRSYFVRLIPAERSGEFFGFYNMMGKFAAVLGPFLMGVTAQLTGSPRMAILPVLALFALGGGILYKVKEEG